MTVKEFIVSLSKKNFSLSVEDGKLNLKGDRKKLSKSEIDAIKANKEIIDYIKTHKAELIEYITLNAEHASSGKSKDIESIYRLSGLQQGMLFHGLYNNQDGGAYKVHYNCDLLNLDCVVFKRSWRHIVNQHSVLRSAFFYDSFNIPVQCVYRNVDLPVTEIDCRGMDEASQRTIVNEYEELERQKGFDFKQAPLTRFTIIRLSEDRYRMLWTTHHILFDGWSLAILLEEFLTTYEALLSGKELKSTTEDRFEDYIRYLERTDNGQGETYWRNYVKDIEQSTLLPFIEKTTERTKGSGHYKSLPLQIDAETTLQIQNFAQRNRITVNTLMQGVWARLLHHYTGEENVLYGIIVSGRPDDLPGVEQRVGIYINTLPLNCKVQKDDKVVKWLQGIQEEQVLSRKHQHTPLSEIQKWTGVPGDLFDTLFVFENYPVNKLLLAKTWSLGVENIQSLDQTNYPLTLLINSAEHIHINFSYNTELLQQAYVKEISEHFQNVLLQFIANEESNVSDINLLSPSEEHQLTEGFNATSTAYPRDKSLIDLFEEQVARTPDAIALVFQGQELSYQELNNRSNQLGHYLISKGISKETLVPIVVERSPEMVIGILGILKSGAAYVPVDPEYPEDRIGYMLEDSGAVIVITSLSSKSRIGSNAAGVELIALDGKDQESISSQPTHNPGLSISPDQLAYVIYTSGSTGKPKGVMMPGGNLVNLLHWQEKQFHHQNRRVLQFASLTFDVSFQEIFSTLCYGSRLYLVDSQKRKDIPALLSDISQNQITHLFIPYIVLQSLAEYLYTLPGYSSSLEEIIVAGEQLKLSPEIQALLDNHQIKLINQYGPTEAHVVSSYTIGQDGPSPILPPIGKPIDNVTLYILNSQGQLCPVGVPGELYIGGAQVARGYLNQPELTAEKFISHPFRKENDQEDQEENHQNEKVYKTGDLCRWLPDGNIEYLGRIDSQVKIRGYRIELGEIESLLQQSDQISGAVVLAKADSNGMKRLVAYVVPGDHFSKEETISRLQGKLPEYMVPAIWVELESFPVTPNGKVDRKALPEPEGKDLAGKAYVAPRNELEVTLASIWGELLSLDQVGIHDNFFELGGHSLLVTRVISAIRRELKSDVGVKDLFLYPTIAELSTHLNLSEGEKAPVILPQPRPEEIPLSFSQERLWFIDQFEGSIEYHIPAVLRLRGKLNIDALASALKTIVNRHEILRTVYKEKQGQPYQYIKPADQWNLTIAREEEFNLEPEKYTQRFIQEPFNLSDDYMFRASLISIAADEYVLLSVMHHIASDGWSISILVKEVVELYEAYTEKREVQLKPLSIQYADYALWQKEHLPEDVLKKKLNYWQNKLERVSYLELSTDYRRPATPSGKGGTVRLNIEKDLIDKLQALSRKQNATLFMTLLAAFKVLLYRYSAQEDICVGTPIANRTQQEVEGLIGFFLNTLALRSKLSGELAFTELLSQLRNTTLEAYENQDVPFEKIVEKVVQERDLSRTPLFQVMFILQNTPEVPELRFGDVQLSGEPIKHDTSKFDLIFSLTEGAYGLNGSVQFSTDLYDKETIAAMAGHFKELLYSIVNKPEEKVSTLRMLKIEEENNLLAKFNTDSVQYPDKNLVALIEEQAAKTPDNIALIFGDKQLTYRQFNERSNQLAHYLQRKAIKNESLVPICIDKSFEMIIGILGILKAGGAYVPIDPEYPTDRIRFMLEDTNATVILSSEKALNSLNKLISKEKTVALDIQWNEIQDYPLTNLNLNIAASQFAYTLYTSGSTGKPKGVQVQHKSLSSHLHWFNNQYQISESDSTLLLSSFSFDGCMTSMWPVLTKGGQLHLPENNLLDTDQVLNYVSDNSLSYLKTLPGIFKTIIHAGNFKEQGICKSLRLIILGGERVDPADIKAYISLYPDTLISNHYGPTECTISSSFHLVNKHNIDEFMKRPVIGKPIDNTQIYILAENGLLSPVGVVGELFIGGQGVAKGYLNDEKLTSEKFVSDTFKSEPDARMYRTGDLGRWLPNGSIEFLGRLDDQVKIRGYRVELGEIENIIQLSGLVQHAVVLAKDDEGGNTRLVAYTVPGESYSQKALGSYLKDQLPAYMIPSLYKELDSLPLSPNGKADRKALPEPDYSGLKAKEYIAPRDITEEKIAVIWQELLNVQQVGVHDNFFELGGHSLLGMRVMSFLRKELGVEISVKDIFVYPTIAELAKRLNSQTEGVLLPAIQKQERPQYIPLSFSQERLWFIDRLEGSGSYHMSSVLELKGQLDKVALENTLRAIVERHEVLRTVIRERDGIPYQYILNHDDWNLTILDGDLYKESSHGRSHYRQQLIDKPFELSRDYMLRADLICVNEHEHVLVLTMHHIASDGWSTSVLVKEVAELYRHFTENSPLQLEPLDIQYADYAIWQRSYLQGELLDKKIDYWKNKLEGAIPLELTTDYPRPPVQSSKGAIATFTIDKDLSGRLQLLSKQQESTLFMTLLSAFNILLFRYSNQEDICIGTGIAGREQQELESLIGFFVNTLALRNSVNASESFTELLQQVKTTTLEAYENRDVPFERVVDAVVKGRDTSRSSLFQVMFALSNIPEVPKLNFKALELSSPGSEYTTSKFDITVIVTETEDGIKGAVEYCTDLFSEETVLQMFNHFKVLLGSIVQEPNASISKLPMLTSAERQTLSHEFNKTKAVVGDGRSVIELFEAEVTKNGDALALVFQEELLSYSELNARSNQLAHYLISKGVTSGSLVPILMERSAGMITAILGILKAGCVYIPIDPNYPAERISYQLEDTKAGMVVSSKAGRSALPEINAIQLIEIDGADAHFISSQPDTNPGLNISLDDLAYVIYTSGSTGRPKGVQIQHGSLINYLLNSQARYVSDTKGQSGTFIHLSYTFDASLTGIFMPLLNGRSLIISSKSGAEVFEDSNLLKYAPYDFLKITPSHLELLERTVKGSGGEPWLTQTLVIGGEALYLKQFDYYIEKGIAIKIVNEYGPTEATVGCSTYSFITTADNHKIKHNISIGKPMDNVQLYVLDHNQNLQPIGVAGEICIGGAGVALGYLNQPELTAEKFIKNPFSENSKSRIYRTGDLGRWLPDGNLEYLGRTDDQVKIRGYRIEPGEIEACISSVDQIKQARVLVADKKLNAYLQVDKNRLPLLGNYQGLLNRKQIRKTDLNILPNGLPVLSPNLNEVRFLYNEVFEDHCYLKHGINLSKDSCVLDIGANVGFFTVFLNVLSENIKIYSVEPIPEVYNYLAANRELYNIKGKAFQVAITDKESEVHFTYYPQVSIVSGISEDREQVKEVVRSYIKHSDTNELVAEEIDSVLEAKLDSKRIKVQTKTVSQIIAEENIEKIDLLKIDVENSEHLVINGISENDWDKIESIIIEIHDVDGRLENIRGILEQKGFNTYVEKEQMLSEDDILYNLFALRNTTKKELTSLDDRDILRSSAWSHPAELIKEVKSEIEKQLPEYMIPANMILVDHFPMTRNGKLDKSALPEPDSTESLSNEYEVPITDNEKELVRIWQQLLEIDTVGIHDNFFELGGDSLTAVRLVSIIRKELSVELAISDIFDYPSVASLAGRLQGKSDVTVLPPVIAQSRPLDIPLSFSQERLWFIDRLEGSIQYHIPAVLRLKGKLDTQGLENAIKVIVNRHEVLRTVILEKEGRGYQYIQDKDNWRLNFINGSIFNHPDKLKQQIKGLVDEPFDLSKDHMLRADLITLAEEEFILVVTMHHIASDGWSLSILIREVVELYSSYQDNRDPLLAPMVVQFADYAIWQRTQLQGDVLNDKITYWKKKLTGVEPLQLPTDYAKPEVQSNRGAVIGFNLNSKLSEDLQVFSQNHNTTLFMTLLAGFKVLLHKYTGQDDICVGTTVAGRQQQEIEGLIGFFLNTIALRSTVEKDLLFTDFIQSVKTTTLEAYTNQEVPFEKVVDAVVKGRDPGRSPLFSVVLVLQNIPDVPELSFGGVTLSSETPEIKTTKFDIICTMIENEQGLRGTIQYSTDLFSATTIERLISHFKALLTSIISNPIQKVSELSLQSITENNQLAEESINQDQPVGKSIVSLFTQQAITNPDLIAVIFEQDKLSYKELNERSNQLAHYLKSKGVKENSLVLLCIERSVEMITGILGVLKAGGAYVPIDPEYPEERINYVFNDTGSTQILSSKASKERLEFLTGADIIELDGQWPLIALWPISDLKTIIKPDQLAYVIYTSGSTGKPKGVMIPHSGNVNMSLDQIRQFGITSADKVLQFASISFDASVSEIFMAFYAGATLVLMSKAMIQDAEHFAYNAKQACVSVVTLPPVYLRTLKLDDLRFLRVIITAGEPADVKQAAYLSSFLEYYNAYGPTECSVCVTIYKVNPEDKIKSRIPIGRPIAETAVYILDDNEQLVPEGMQGEMYVSGAGLALGYLGKPELTAEKFIDSPFNKGEKLYKTGDVVRELADGNIEFIGRRDDQIKIRGYRVELGEIEHTLLQNNNVDSCVVVVKEDKEEKQLLAYYKVKKKIRLWPSVAEFYVYDDLLYQTMAGDEARNAKYRNAISKVVKDKIILEIGPGFEAILSRICIEEGAKKVYAVELLESSYLKAKETVEALGLQDKIIVIHDNIMNVELPEKVDYCISEIVGAIGGSEGAATLINSSRRLLKDPACMIPSRSLTKIAAITLPEDQFDNSFEELGAYYTSKIFEQAGRKFDLRVYLNSFPAENIISNEEVFEDLDYTRESKLEDEHHIFLVFQQDSVVNGFIVWLNLYCDNDELIDTINGKYTWLPIYFPAFDEGEAVSKADYIKAKVSRKISSNGLNPDFKIEGTLIRNGQANKDFVYESMNCSELYRGNSFYKKIFENDSIKVAEKADKEALKIFLKEKLPDYMIPSMFIELEDFPLTISGKIDKKALPDPDTAELLADQYLEPRNETEQVLVNIWQDVLELDKVGIKDDFFELGGHSLLAIRLISVIRKELNIEVPIGDIFENPTIESLASHLQSQSASTLLPVINVQSRPSQIPLSFSQERLYFIDRLQGSVQYHIPAVLRLKGALNTDALEYALRSVLKRHEVLRTIILEQDGLSYQQVIEESKWALETIDATESHEIVENLSQLIEGLIHSPFDLSKDYMLRANVIRLNKQEHILVVIMHHIASDGWSTSIIVKELIEFYDSYLEQRNPVLSDLTIQFADYAIWQRSYLQGEILAEKLAYWKEKLQGVTALQLTVDYTRPTVQTFKGASASVNVDQELTFKLQELSHQRGVTLFMTLLTAFKVLLYRYSGQQDICVGTPVANRNQQETEKLVGFFVNTLPLRSDLRGDTSFNDLLKQVKATTLEAYAHQDVPFEKIVDAVVKERDLNRSPLFQVMFALQNAPEIPEILLIDVVAVSEGPANSTSKFDISCSLIETGSGLSGSIQYNTDLYKEETIKQFETHFTRLLYSIVASPDQKIGELKLLSPSEEHQLTEVFNATSTAYPRDKSLIDLFEEQVKRTPDAIALVFQDQELSYQELNNRSNQLGHYLISKGISKETLVPIVVERSPEMVIGILGILKSGAAYVPVDPEYPEDRIGYMLEDSGAVMVLSSVSSKSQIGSNATGVELIALDGKDQEGISSQPTNNPGLAISPEQLAYVIYTSGSTGQPKGVMIEHKNACSFISWCQEEFSTSHFRMVYAATSICFDLSIFELFYPLSIGKPFRILKNGLDISNHLAHDKDILLNTVPSVVANLLAEGTDFSHVSVLNMAGEPVSIHILQGLDTNRMEVRNLYGPTEDTTYSTVFQLKKDKPVLIGKPISNTQIYILSADYALAPLGIAGEICISGDGQARGYLNKPELSAEKFIQNPFDDKGASKLYKTGDLGRWLPDGNIEYIGRIDDQVKIRGYRIEPGEIEHVLQQSELITQAVVLAKEDNQGNKRLIGYVIATNDFDKEAIQSYLQGKLPEYMVPSLWIVLDEFPLTSNGKINRNALPDPDITSLLKVYQPPSNTTEKSLATLWGNLLHIDRVGIHDNFFELGGNSLLAMRLISMIRRELEIELPIKNLFFYPTIAKLATSIQLQSKSENQDINVIHPRPAHFPLSFSQERLWFIDQLEGSVQYHMPVILRLRGLLDTSALSKALQGVVNRHEVLRTVIAEEEGSGYQQILSENSWELDITDGSTYASDSDKLQAYIISLTQAPFDLSKDHMLRATLIELNPLEQVLVATMHHIASDGWSASILVKEVVELYKAFTENREAALPPLEIQYADYSIWQRNYLQGEVWDKKLGYWKTQLQNAAVLQLPTDYSRPAVQSTRGGSIGFTVDKNLSADLQALSQAQGTTLFMTLLSAFKVLLHRYSGQEDISVGSPAANRTHHEVEPLIGFFVNTLTLRSQVEGDMSFKELLQEVKNTTLEAYSHQDVPFEKVVEAVMKERDMSRSPLFQVMFVFQNTPEIPKLQFGEVELSSEGFAQQTSKYDLSLFITQSAAGLQCSLEYNTDLYKEETIEQLETHFTRLLHSIVASPDQKIGELTMLTPSEEHQLIEGFNATSTDYPRDKSLIDLFEEQVASTPDAIAVVFQQGTLTYKELNERSNQLAHYLQSEGIQKETLIPICIERGLEMIIALLGILKAGGVFVPIDPEYPLDRIDYMLTDTKANMILSSKKSRSKLQTLAKIDIIEIDGDQIFLHNHLSENLGTPVRPDQLAYLIYTSGSTGNPKGVMIQHNSLVNLLTSIIKYLDFKADSCFLSVTTFSFDICYLEFFVPLISGGKLVVVPRDLAIDGYKLANSIAQHLPTHMQGTPSTWQLLLDSKWRNKESLKILIGGEAVKETIKEQLTQIGTVYNLYGPTETTIWSAIKKLTANERVLIGKPIDNTSIFILNDQEQLCPPKIVGQICIGGDGLARGYLNQPDLTNKKFIRNRFSKFENDRLYKTGDFGRWLPDGNIEYLGRLDDQVKIRGYRIELGEIEAALQKVNFIDQAVVVTKTDAEGDKQLISYYVPSNKAIKVKEKELFSRQVATWQAVYETEYAITTEGDNNEEFDINIWKDSFTGQPIPPVQMQEWLQDIVELIMQENPDHVLEIGSGTGLIYYQLAGKIKKYIGTDIAASSINKIKQRINNSLIDYGPTELYVCAAHEVSLPDDQDVDTIVLNSVVQYFPGEDYMNEVISKCVSTLKDGGRIIIGDVRDNRLLELFKMRLEMQKLSSSVSIDELIWLAGQEVLKEEELCFSPEYFYNLQIIHPIITHVDIKWKKSSYSNELSKYRYNVVLHIGKEIKTFEPRWQLWDGEATNQNIHNQIRSGESVIAIQGAPNNRLSQEKLLHKTLKDKTGSTVGDLLPLIESGDSEARFVTEIIEIAKKVDYSLKLLVNRDPFKFDILLEKEPSGKFIRQVHNRKPSGCDASFTNIPLFTDITLSLQKDIRSLLFKSLPEYMVPSKFIAIANLPLTNNGKVNRKFLGERVNKTIGSKLNYEEPKTKLQQILVDIWQELLGAEQVGIHDNFFELGGHSLLAVKMVSQIKKRLMLSIPIQVLFQFTTISELSNYLQWSEDEDTTSYEVINI
jgi:amino acid adenylation domain-containing protein/FkbM family methyltransferase